MICYQFVYQRSSSSLFGNKKWAIIPLRTAAPIVIHTLDVPGTS